MHVIEFKKRSIPHTHTVDQIDQLIYAKIPDDKLDPVGYHIVKHFMIHGPCGNDCKNSPCLDKKKCIRHFLKRYNKKFIKLCLRQFSIILYKYT